MSIADKQLAEKFSERSAHLRRVAFTAVVCNTLTVAMALFSFPTMIFHVQSLHFEAQDHVDYCKSKTSLIQNTFAESSENSRFVRQTEYPEERSHFRRNANPGFSLRQMLRYANTLRYGSHDEPDPDSETDWEPVSDTENEDFSAEQLVEPFWNETSGAWQRSVRRRPRYQQRQVYRNTASPYARGGQSQRSGYIPNPSPQYVTRGYATTASYPSPSRYATTAGYAPSSRQNGYETRTHASRGRQNQGDYQNRGPYHEKMYGRQNAYRPPPVYFTSSECCTCSRGMPGGAGLPGSDGTKGTDGTNGNPGNPGPPAPIVERPTNFPPQCPCQAPTGAPGEAGPKGPPGLAGPMGSSGSDALPGPEGETGPKGSPGTIGGTGSKGIQGAPGNIQTIEGKAGPGGPPGTPGQPGRGGAMGQMGEPGQPGGDGPTGDTGPRGNDGPDGYPGVAGYPGGLGLPGSCQHCSYPRLAPGY